MSDAGQKTILKVELQTFAYATEDVDKVEKALTNILGNDVGYAKLTHSNLTGHFKDPITIIKAIINKKKPTSALFNRVLNGMSSLDIFTLLDELSDRVDTSGNLYIRFDKQKAFKGVLYLNMVDPIRIKFNFRIPHRMDPSEHIRSIIEERSTI